MTREIKFRAWDKNRGVIRDEVIVFPGGWKKAHRGGDFDTLMQFTGLKDKNGKEIYEGDVVATEKFSGNAWKNKLKNAEVFWDTDTAGFLLRCEGEETGCVSNPFDEIIGNIYENPELLSPTETK